MNENESKATRAVCKSAEEMVKDIATASIPADGVGNVNEWGSCQYDTARQVYMELLKLELCYGKGPVITKLSIKVGPVIPFEGEVLKSFKESHLTDLAVWDSEGEDVSELRTALEDVSNVAGAFHFLRDWSWDLWSAAPYMAASTFPELNLDNVPDAPGFGPVFNVMAQSDNCRVGTICWLLKCYGFVEDDEPFQGFDT